MQTAYRRGPVVGKSGVGMQNRHIESVYLTLFLDNWKLRNFLNLRQGWSKQ